MNQGFLVFRRAAALGRPVLATMLLTMWVTASSASAQQDIRPLLDRMERLERDVSLVQRQVYRGGTPVSSSSDSSSPSIRDMSSASGGSATGSPTGIDGRLLQRIADLESVLAGITGQVEEVSFRVGQVSSRVEKFAADVEYRLGQLEQRASGAPPADEEVKPPVALGGHKGKDAERTKDSERTKDAVSAFGHPKAPDKSEPANAEKNAGSDEEGTLPSGNPKEQYEYISSLLGQANYVGAEKALTAFLAAHPDDPLAGNAQYWLGETYYVRNDYAKAAGVFAKGYQKYPKSGKAAANVLKLGLSLARLKRGQDACTAFGRLASEFPNATGDIMRRAAQERKQLDCK